MITISTILIIAHILITICALYVWLKHFEDLSHESILMLIICFYPIANMWYMYDETKDDAIK